MSRLAYTAYREISGSNSEETEKTEEEQPRGSRGPEPSFTGKKDDAEYAMKQAKYCDERADWAIKMHDYSSADSWMAKAKEWRAQAAK